MEEVTENVNAYCAICRLNVEWTFLPDGRLMCTKCTRIVDNAKHIGQTLRDAKLRYTVCNVARVSTEAKLVSSQLDIQ